MDKNPLLKYRIGLAVLGVFTLAMVGLVLFQANATKQDAATDKRANDIADKLNQYVDSKQTIPASLSDVGVGDVPSTITYSKESADSYKFCVNYKATSSNFDSSSVALSLATGGKVDSGNNDYSSKTYLYLPSSHHKGANCQTISPYVDGTGSGRVTCGYLCEPTSNGNTIPLTLGGGGSADDTRRKTDINALQSHLESYYATNGYYPTLSDLNSTSWVAMNLKGFDESSLCDPSVKASACQLASSPAKGVYSYEVQDDSYQNCTTESKCSSYILTATLSDGTEYTKYSL